MRLEGDISTCPDLCYAISVIVLFVNVSGLQTAIVLNCVFRMSVYFFCFHGEGLRCKVDTFQL